MNVVSSIIKQLEDIKQDVGKIANKIARGVAQQALNDMENAHTMIMMQYYESYTPVRSYSYISPKTGARITTNGYRRTGNLMSNSLIPQGLQQIGPHGFLAKVEIGPSGMNDYVNQSGRVFPAAGVFDLVWNQGIRGLPPGYPGYVGTVTTNLNYNGITISGTPGYAMESFVEQWWDAIGSDTADRIAYSV